MTPIRTVSAWAWAKRQSRLSAVAAAAEFFRSVLREVFIAFLPGKPSFERPIFFYSSKYLENGRECQRRAASGNFVREAKVPATPALRFPNPRNFRRRSRFRVRRAPPRKRVEDALDRAQSR